MYQWGDDVPFDLFQVISRPPTIPSSTKNTLQHNPKKTHKKTVLKLSQDMSKSTHSITTRSHYSCMAEPEHIQVKWKCTFHHRGILFDRLRVNATGPATASPILYRHRRWWDWKSHRPERYSATDPLPSKDLMWGTAYWRQSATQDYQLLSFLIKLRLTSLFNSFGICNSEQTPI